MSEQIHVSKINTYLMFRLRRSDLDTGINVGVGVENLVIFDSRWHFVCGFQMITEETTNRHAGDL
jgi:hypothetical protein